MAREQEGRRAGSSFGEPTPELVNSDFTARTPSAAQHSRRRRDTSCTPTHAARSGTHRCPQTPRDAPRTPVYTGFLHRHGCQDISGAHTRPASPQHVLPSLPMPGAGVAMVAHTAWDTLGGHRSPQPFLVHPKQHWGPPRASNIPPSAPGHSAGAAPGR